MEIVRHQLIIDKCYGDTHRVNDEEGINIRKPHSIKKWLAIRYRFKKKPLEESVDDTTNQEKNETATQDRNDEGIHGVRGPRSTFLFLFIFCFFFVTSIDRTLETMNECAGRELATKFFGRKTRTYDA